MARSSNRSDTSQITISVPTQTFNYLVRLATVGALGQNEAIIAAKIVVDEVERLMDKGRAEKIHSLPPLADDK